jgi:hypothetical protein
MQKLYISCYLSLWLGIATYGQTPAFKTQEECPEEVCELPQINESGEALYSVVAPIGIYAVKKIEQAPRLSTLNGKKIALVGGSFNATITHLELKRLLESKYPKAQIFLFSEVGTAGQYYPHSKQVKSFQRKLQSLGIEAVISGNAGCGICTLKEVGNSISAEYIGIPAVTIGAPTFVKQIVTTSLNHGLPAPRVAIYPGAFSSHSREELIENTRKHVLTQVEDALTKPITQIEIEGYQRDSELHYSDILLTGTLEEVQALFQERRWTDGLPILPPTPKRIQDFLQYTDMAEDEVVGIIPPGQRKVLVWHVAANGVMSGCPPEFMPLLIAYTQALSHGDFRRPLVSTHGWTPYGWVNGPVARQLGIDFGQGMISEPRNAVLGRFINLIMQNLAGYHVKENRMGTFGYLTPWTFAEDEEACLKIGWQPYHVEQGFGLHDNLLTAGSALLWGNNLTPATPDPDKIMELMAWDITEKQQNALGSTNPNVYRTIFITEFVARDLSKKYPSKKALEQALIQTARRPAYMRAYARYWANPGSQQFEKYSFGQFQSQILKKENASMTALPPWFPSEMKTDKIHTVAVMENDMTPILVTGDPHRNKVQIMPGGAYVSISIRLPKNWDSLMDSLGYEPLERFYLKP